MESGREYERYECWEVSRNLGRALQGNRHRRYRSILLGGSRRETASPAMEHPQSKKVLSINCRHPCMLGNVK